MSLALLAQGTLVQDPQSRISGKGRAYATALLRAAIVGEEAMLLSLIAFSDTAVGDLLELRKGDQIAITGSGKPSSWTGRDGKECHGLSVTVERVLGLYEVRQRRKATDKTESPAEAVRAPAAAVKQIPYDRSQPIEAMTDDIPF